MWALLAALAWGQDEPSVNALAYYNARMALREGLPLEAVKLWLLRNAIEDQTGTVSAHDGDFRTVTWAALGELGICQDGFPDDVEGANLWRLALHNWVVRNMGRRVTKGPKPFEAFQVGRQARLISIGDVLGSADLKTVALARGQCWRPRLMAYGLGEDGRKLNEAPVAAQLMLALLLAAGKAPADDRISGWAAVDARVFDLHLQIAGLAAREARNRARDQARLARELGLTRESTTVMREEAPKTLLTPESPSGRILAASVDWPVSEWMALSPERRVFLYDQARTFGGDAGKMDAIAIGVVDALIADGKGEELDAWIARSGDAERIWMGERGERLLAMDADAGFTERSAIALPRGVRSLEEGDLRGALRALSYALSQAPESRESEEVQSLTRRWLSYTAARFESTEELLVTLRELVPARDYSIILEDLMWRAAFHADRASFERGMASQVGRGALDRRLGLLAPLAAGDNALFAARIRQGLVDSPSETLRFLDQLVERLELEEAPVRAAHVPMLNRVRELVRPLSVDTGQASRSTRVAGEWMARTQAILEGEGLIGIDVRDRARSLDPSGEVFAGSVRLAPADPFPWPFEVQAVGAPSVFLPLKLKPIEWTEDGEIVFGWRIEG